MVDCLEDPDDTLKKKTLELLFKMTKPNNVEVHSLDVLVPCWLPSFPHTILDSTQLIAMPVPGDTAVEPSRDTTACCQPLAPRGLSTMCRVRIMHTLVLTPVIAYHEDRTRRSSWRR